MILMLFILNCKGFNFKTTTVQKETTNNKIETSKQIERNKENNKEEYKSNLPIVILRNEDGRRALDITHIAFRQDNFIAVNFNINNLEIKNFKGDLVIYELLDNLKEELYKSTINSDCILKVNLTEDAYYLIKLNERDYYFNKDSELTGKRSIFLANNLLNYEEKDEYILDGYLTSYYIFLEKVKYASPSLLILVEDKRYPENNLWNILDNKNLLEEEGRYIKILFSNLLQKFSLEDKSTIYRIVYKTKGLGVESLTNFITVKRILTKEN